MNKRHQVHTVFAWTKYGIQNPGHSSIEAIVDLQSNACISMKYCTSNNQFIRTQRSQLIVACHALPVDYLTFTYARACTGYHYHLVWEVLLLSQQTTKDSSSCSSRTNNGQADLCAGPRNVFSNIILQANRTESSVMNACGKRRRGSWWRLGGNILEGRL